MWELKMSMRTSRTCLFTNWFRQDCNARWLTKQIYNVGCVQNHYDFEWFLLCKLLINDYEHIYTHSVIVPSAVKHMPAVTPWAKPLLLLISFLAPVFIWILVSCVPVLNLSRNKLVLPILWIHMMAIIPISLSRMLKPALHGVFLTATKSPPPVD